MVHVVDGKISNVSKLAYAKYLTIHGKFQEHFDREKTT
jgi:hypothetical protein